MTAVDRLAEIEARANAATPGPWRLEVHEVMHSYKTHTVYRVEDGGNGIIASTEQDADFIAHAREDIPALIAEVRSLCAALTTRQQVGREAVVEVERLRRWQEAAEVVLEHVKVGKLPAMKAIEIASGVVTERNTDMEGSEA